MEDLASEIVAQSKGGYSKLALSISSYGGYSSGWTKPVLLFTSRDASDMLLSHVLKRRNGGETKEYQLDYANFDAAAELISTVLNMSDSQYKTGAKEMYQCEFGVRGLKVAGGTNSKILRLKFPRA
jgi:hypothetical protein